jgi:hypothetical protein
VYADGLNRVTRLLVSRLGLCLGLYWSSGGYERRRPRYAYAVAPAQDIEPGSDGDFDLSAAGLRADGNELRISVDVLAAKLEEALPGQTRVQRRGGGLLGRGERRVRELCVELGATRYRLGVEGERLECSREREVGGISIKREPLDPKGWMSALGDELRTEAERSSEAREALTRLLG